MNNNSNEYKEYHIQLAVFEVTKSTDNEEETWDWVQEINFCNPTRSYQEMLPQLTLMFMAFDYYSQALEEELNVDDPKHTKDLDTINEFTMNVEKAFTEMFPCTSQRLAQISLATRYDNK